MGHSRSEKAQSRERILRAASLRMRERGLDALSVADLMAAAGLTHGGFYGHFASRKALLAAALERALLDGDVTAHTAIASNSASSINSIVEAYLDPIHRDDPGRGCAIAAVGSEIARADTSLRQLAALRAEQSFVMMSRAHGDLPQSREFALASWSMMIGAILLARIFEGDPRSDEILEAARASVKRLAAVTKQESQPTKG